MFYGIFLLAFLAGCISGRSLSDSSTDVENNNSSEKRLTLMQFLQNIFQDPEYLALSDYKQLVVLEVIYSILETSYIQQQRTKSKNQAKIAFVN